MLLLKFHEAIYLEGDVRVTKRSLDSTIKYAYDEISSILNAKDSLKRVKKSTSVAAYRSSIALKISAQTQRNVAEIAQKIVDFYGDPLVNSQEKDTSLSGRILSDLTVSAIAGSFLEFEFGDRAIAAWLQGLTDFPDLNFSNKSWRDDFTNNSHFKSVQNGQANIFLCQYTYARCCSVLRMALERESAVKEFPWLTEAGILGFESESDRALLAEMITVMDESVATQDYLTQDYLKWAVSLSRAFQAFYQENQLFGKVWVKNPRLAQRRLGLVMITQWLLGSLLQEGLGIIAPDTL